MQSVGGLRRISRHRASCTGEGPNGYYQPINYVALDVHKAALSAALAESGRSRETRRLGVFKNRPELLAKLAARLSKSGRRLSFCYEVGPCGSTRAATGMNANS